MRGHLPLEGLRVLDLASFIAGPVATTVLGDYGAEVIKIEPPGEGDPQRKLGQAHSVPQHPVNFCWHMTNRNKRAIVLDLKHPEGRSVFERLLKTADVMVVNFPLKVRDAASHALRGRGAHQPAPDLRLDDGLRRERARRRAAGLRFDGVLRPLRPARRAHARGRTARLLAAGAGRPDGRHEPVRRHRHGAAASRAHRRGQRSQHLAACRRPVVQRHPGAGRAARRLCGAAAAAHQAAQRARQPVPHRRRPLDPAHHRARGQIVARALQGDGAHRPAGRPALPGHRQPPRAMRPSWRRSSIRCSPPIPGRNGASACAITRSPSACSACCATCRTIIRRWPTARWWTAACPTCRARSPRRSGCPSPPNR